MDQQRQPQFQTSDTPAVEIREFQVSDAYRFSYRHRPACGESPLGYVVALHGIQSHSGWYEFSSARMSAAGFDVCFLDRRGSGLNEIDRGHAMHVDRLINDVVQFAGHLRHLRGDEVPIILLGVSWGGKLAAAIAARRLELFDGLALLYPGICTRFRPKLLQQQMLKLAVACGGSRRLTPIPLDNPALFTGNPHWRQFIVDDPLALHEVTTSFLKASCDLDDLMQTAPEQIVIPALLMLAGRDQIINNDATKKFFTRFATPARHVIEYAEAEHTLEFEACREQFLEDLILWLQTVQPR